MIILFALCASVVKKSLCLSDPARNVSVQRRAGEAIPVLGRGQPVHVHPVGAAPVYEPEAMGDDYLSLM